MDMRVFRALLVDDERIARLRLRQLLKAHGEIQIVGEASDVVEAAKLARELKPDVIFLDVQMPRRDGFALLPKLEATAHIVFVTSYDRHALKGFEINALDYLLKPVEPARLKLTIQRLYAVSQGGAPVADGPSVNDLIVVGDSGHSRTTTIGALASLQAEGNYTRLSITDGGSPMLMLRGLSDWEALLPAPPFIRLDRSIIVNLRHVRDFTPESRDRATLVLAGAKEAIALGRTASTRLRSALREVAARVTA